MELNSRFDVAKKSARDSSVLAAKQNKEKGVIKSVAGQKLITNSFAVEDSEDEECESADKSASDTESDESEEEEPDVDDCNARPCIIDQVIAKSKETVEWVQCRLCPRWFHQHCAQIDDEQALLFECNIHK